MSPLRAQQKAALKKLEYFQKDHEKRLQGLQQEQGSCALFNAPRATVHLVETWPLFGV
jgi:hypothetical protein